MFGGPAAAATPRPETAEGAPVSGNRKYTRAHITDQGDSSIPVIKPETSGRSTAPTSPLSLDPNGDLHSQGSNKLSATLKETPGGLRRRASGPGTRTSTIGRAAPLCSCTYSSQPTRTKPTRRLLGKASLLTEKRWDQMKAAEMRMAND